MGRKRKQVTDIAKKKLELLPFVCGLCSSKFTYIDKFYQHFISHKDEVTEEYFHLCDIGTNNEQDSGYCPFECSLCKYTFPTICQLHNHFCHESKVVSYKIDLKKRSGIPNPVLCHHLKILSTVPGNSTKVVKVGARKWNLPLPNCVVKVADCSVELDNLRNSKVASKFASSTDILTVKRRKSDRSGKVNDSFSNRRSTRACQQLYDDTSATTEVVTDSQDMDTNYVAVEQTYPIKAQEKKKETEVNIDEHKDCGIDLMTGDTDKDSEDYINDGIDDDHDDDDNNDDNIFTVVSDVKSEYAEVESKVTSEQDKYQDVQDDHKPIMSELMQNDDQFVNIPILCKDEVAKRKHKKEKKKKKIPKWKLDPNHVKKPRGPGTSNLCEICFHRVKKVNFQAHLLSHLSQDTKRANSVGDKSITNEVNKEDITPRQLKRRSTAKRSFKEFRDSDLESDEENKTETVSEFEEFSDNNLEFEGETEVETNFVQETAIIANEEREASISVGDVTPDPISEDQRKAGDLTDVLKRVAKETKSGKTIVEFKYNGLLFKLRPKKLVLFCKICGDEMEDNTYVKHLKKCDLEWNNEFIKDFEEVRRRSKELKFKKKKKTVTQQNSNPDNINNTDSQKNKPVYKKTKASEKVNPEVYFDPNIDYDWDKEPEKKKRKSKIGGCRYEQCHICGIWTRYYSIEKHIDLHNTTAGKKKYSPENLMKCKTCLRICLVSSFPNHRCFVAGIPSFKPEMENTEDDTATEEIIEPQGKKDLHVPEKSVCTICGQLIMRYRMKTHMALKHSDETPFACEECEDKFKLPNLLRSHVLKKHREKMFHCDQCPSAYSTASELRQHYPIHTGEKHAQCTKCHMRFSRVQYLKRHVSRVHDGATPQLMCPHCRKLFFTKSKLRFHINLTHLKCVEKIWVCNWQECNYKAYCGKTLRRHMCIHTGEKPLTCSLCDDRFVQKIEVQAHLKKKHNLTTLPKVQEWYQLAENYKNFVYILNPEANRSKQRKSISFQVCIEVPECLGQTSTSPGVTECETDKIEVAGQQTQATGQLTEVARQQTQGTGLQTEVTGQLTEVAGQQTQGTGLQTEVTGQLTEVAGQQTQATGQLTEVAGQQTQGTGLQTEVTGQLTEVAGQQTQATGQLTEVIGQLTEVTGLQTEVTGQLTEVTGLQTEVTGQLTEVTGLQTEVTGQLTEVAGQQTQATGQLTEVIGQLTEVTGLQTEVTGQLTEVAGQQTQATGQLTEVAGQQTQATGQLTEVIGQLTEVTGLQTEVTGQLTEVAGLKNIDIWGSGIF